MGKHKSKKHHKKSGEIEGRSRGLGKAEKPIKLVLKVSGSQETIVSKERKGHRDKTPKSSSSSEKLRTKEHSKKKKKKRSASKERKKLKLDTGSSACPSPASVLGHDKSRRKRDRHEMEMEGANSVDVERPIKKIHIKPLEPPRDVAAAKQKVKKKHKEPSPLQLCLENLHCTLQRKDIQGFFAYPVNDAIAPGYSRVIGHPIDFSSIKNKIDNSFYTKIETFRDDFYLMCNNAMVYNASETIYYKAAKRILQIGVKMMSQDKIRNMYRSIGFSVPDMDDGGRGGMSDEPIDVDTVDCEVSMIFQSAKKRSKSRSDQTKPSAVGRKILAQVQEAAKRVSAQLKEKYPKSKIGFLRRDKDGSTSLAVLNPDSTQESLPVNLGTVAGKVTSGSHITAGFKEDKRNKATPVSYLMYGPFGSFAPSYDSSRATISKEESDLLYSTYGNDTGIQYAQSIQAFVKDASMFAHGVVDRLLNVLTEGAHSKYITQAQEKLKQEAKAEEQKEQESQLKTLPEKESKDKGSAERKEKGKEDNSQTTAKRGNVLDESKKTNEAKVVDRTVTVDKACTAEKITSDAAGSDVAISIESLLTLSDIGIDMSFLTNSDTTAKFDSMVSSSSVTDPKAAEVDSKLNSTRRLLEDLQEAQYSRLALRPGDSLSATPETATKPSEQERFLAEQLTNTLKELTSQIRPGDVTEVESIRAAMGVGRVPLTATKMEGAESRNRKAAEKTGKNVDAPMEQDSGIEKAEDQTEAMETQPIITEDASKNSKPT